MHLLGTVAGAIGPEAARLSGGITRLEAFAIPGVIEFSVCEEFFWHEGFWKDEDFLRGGDFFSESEEAEGERRSEDAGMLGHGTSFGDGATQFAGG